MKSAKHKYMVTVPAKSAASDTLDILTRIAMKHKAEVLGHRTLKNGDFQFGVSMDKPTYLAMEEFTIAMTTLHAKFKDCGADDGKRAKAETPPPKEKPKPKPKAKDKPKEEKERVPVAVPIKPVGEAFSKWSDLGSPEHDRAVRLLGSGCEDPVMRQWGKFSVDRMALFSAVKRRMEEDVDDGWKKFIASITGPAGSYATPPYALPWHVLEPFVKKAFSKDDAEFLTWHSTHSGRRPS